MRTLLLALFILALASSHIFSLQRTAKEQGALERGEETAYVLPAALVRITALEFDELVSDYIFLKTLTHIGGSMKRIENRTMTEQEWSWIDSMLELSTDLDPYFVDPYYIGNAYLTWDGNKVREANKLLEKGVEHRTWDWTLPFFIGFNDFYFLQDNEGASKYLMEASRRPEATPTLASLAARMAYRERRTETAIEFLKEVLKNTDDPSVKQLYEKRIKALNNVLSLESAVESFKKKYRRQPIELAELVEKRIIKELPQDPYGGSYFLDPKGIIRSTSDQNLEPYKPPHRN